MHALAGGANRLLVGAEILQFAVPTPLGGGRWSLRGLLRGRGGTEQEAMRGHATGTDAVVLDAAIASLDPEIASGVTPTIAAIGLGDSEPVEAVVQRASRALVPLTPVHPRSVQHGDGSQLLSWTRRARGAWDWRDAVDVPLVEESERYLVGIGAPEAPLASWQVTEPRLLLTAAMRSEIETLWPGRSVWVRQQGTAALSDPLLLDTLPA